MSEARAKAGAPDPPPEHPAPDLVNPYIPNRIEDGPTEEYKANDPANPIERLQALEKDDPRFPELVARFVRPRARFDAAAVLAAQGVTCVTADDFRWAKAHIKSTSLLGAVFARQISFDVGAVETIMFRDGFLSEAAACNVWVIKDGKVLGTPKDNLVLEGIRYGLIEEICAAQGIGFELRRLSREEVLNADELLLSSATKEVLAVTTLDGRPVGSGQPGPVYEQLLAGYQKAKALARA